MPIYEYRCPEHPEVRDDRIERLGNEYEPLVCSKCGKTMERVIGAATIHWKGGKPSAQV